MAALAAALNTLLAVVMLLLVIRLIASTWVRGGAFVALAAGFLIMLVAYDVVIAIIASVLMLLAVPTLSRSAVGAALMTGIRAVTDPVLRLVQAPARGRLGEATSIAIAVALLFAVRWIVLLPYLRA